MKVESDLKGCLRPEGEPAHKKSTHQRGGDTDFGQICPFTFPKWRSVKF